MNLLVIRHGVAEDAAAFAATDRPDAARPLTAAGRKKMKKAARGLASLLPELQVVATSPLTRAVETAGIVAAAWGSPEVSEVAALVPGAKPAELVPWLKEQGGRELVAVVGHEPHLSRLVSYLLAGAGGSFLELRKGGACLLEIAGQPGPGAAKLLWLATPKQLRAMRG
jgi:phosphohistidine phosphatase